MRSATVLGDTGLSEALNPAITGFHKLHLKLFRRCRGCSGQSQTWSPTQVSIMEHPSLSYCSCPKLFQSLPHRATVLRTVQNSNPNQIVCLCWFWRLIVPSAKSVHLNWLTLLCSHFSSSYRWCYDFPERLKKLFYFRLFASYIGTQTSWSIHFTYYLVFYQFIIPEMCLMKRTANIGCLFAEWIDKTFNGSWSLSTFAWWQNLFCYLSNIPRRCILHSAASQSFRIMWDWILGDHLTFKFIF